MVNETIIQTLQQGYVPSYFLYITAFVIFLSVIILTKAYKGKKSWGKFPYVMLFSAIISGITIGFLVIMPELITNLVSKMGEFWANF